MTGWLCCSVVQVLTLLTVSNHSGLAGRVLYADALSLGVDRNSSGRRRLSGSRSIMRCRRCTPTPCSRRRSQLEKTVVMGIMLNVPHRLNARVGLRKIIMDTELDQTQPPSLSNFSAARPGGVSRPVSKVPTSHLHQDSHQFAVRPSSSTPSPFYRHQPSGHHADLLPGRSQTIQFASNPSYDAAFDRSFDAPSYDTRDGSEYGGAVQRPRTGMSNYTSHTTHTVRTGTVCHSLPCTCTDGS